MIDFFISYSSKDQLEVKQFYQMIIDSGLSCFMAHMSIKEGSTYAREVPVAIKASNVFLLAVSKYSQESPWVRKELDCARNNNKKIIALQISPTPLSPIYMLYLKDIEVISCYEHSLKAKETIEKLIKEYINDNPERVIQKEE